MRTTLILIASLLLAACATPPAPTQSGAIVSAEAVREDLSALYRGLQSGHYDLYANTPKAEYDTLYADTLASIRDDMTQLEAHVLLQRFTAAGRVAHATLGFPSTSYGPFRESGGRVFPLTVRIAGERLLVAQNLSGDARIAAGQEILAINGTPPAQWFARLRRHVSADTDYLAMAQIEPAFAPLLWLELGEVDAFDIILRAPGGDETTLRVAAATRAEMTAALEAATPAFDINPAERVARMLRDRVAYLRPGIFLNLDSENQFDAAAFHTFVDAAFEEFLAADADTLIVDLRNNPGGDNSFSDHMIAWFADRPFTFASQFRIRVSPEAIASNARRLPNAEAGSVSRQLADIYAGASIGDRIDFPIPTISPREGRRFEGRVFVLVNRRSFSNSVFVAAIVQDYGFGRVLGEPTSDLATTYAATEQFTLPNTGLSVSFPKAFMVRPNGDARVLGVTPDIAIATPFATSTDDSVLQSALREIAASSR